MNFLAWLNSMDPTVNWLDIRDRKGLVGIEEELVQIVEQTGSLYLPPIYDAFFANDDPWSEKKAAVPMEKAS